MKFQTSIFIVVILIFTQISCKKDPPIVPPVDPLPYEQSIFLAIDDSGLTEVYLSLAMTDTLPPRGFEIFRNNSKILSGSLFGKETTLVDATAQMNTAYNYQAFRVDGALRNDSSAIIATKTLDTTSHEFVWNEYTFGGTSSSVFFGVTILNNNVIYALGNISNGDSIYAIARRSGNDWELIGLLYRNQEGDTLNLSIIRDLFVKNSTSMYFFSGSIFEWDTLSSVASLTYSRFSLPNLGGTIDKSFGISSDNIFAVGRGGSIIHFNGSKWNPLSSGTTVDLTDVWGTPDGSTVWACGYNSNFTSSVLLQYTKKTDTWQTLWTKGGALTYPFDIVGSIWGNRKLYIASGAEVYELNGNAIKEHSPWFQNFIYHIRGNGENDIVAVTGGGGIWHYNGSNWKKIYSNAQRSLYSVSIKDNQIVAVGVYENSFPEKAFVLHGKRY